jgi:ketosteroid isomerase-like protein
VSQENVELARRGYAGLNAFYKGGDFLPAIRETCDPEVVLKPSGLFPEAGEMRGHEGMLLFAERQAEAFEEMWIEPQEFIDAGDRVVVPLRFGGRARHTGIEAEFSVVHVWTVRNAKAIRIDMYRSKAEALDVAGRRE